MSTPPETLEKPTARFMMDGIIHNLARKQRQKPYQSQKKASLPQEHRSPGLDQPTSASDESPENLTLDYFTISPSERTRKGILKSPTVHFPEEIAAVPQPPTLFDPAIEADEYLNEAAYKLYTKFIDELSEFVDLQGKVTRMRLAVQERRQELKRLRERVFKCDMHLIDHLRQFAASCIPFNDPKFTAYFEASQAARDLVGPLEAEYEPLEIVLGAEEHKLTEKYASIESRFEHFFRLNATSSTKQSIPSKIEYEPSTAPSASGDQDLYGNDPRDPDLFHGAFIGDNVGVGQLPLRAGELPSKTGSHRDIQDLSQMPHFSSEAQDPSKGLRSSATLDETVEGDVPTELLGIVSLESEPRDRRISHSLKGVDSHTLFEIYDYPSSLPEDLLIDSALQEGDSLLLQDEDIRVQSTLSNYLISFNSTRDRVNRWLLHQLRISLREVCALRREVTFHAPDVLLWTTLALDEWSNDVLGHGQSYHQGSIEDESDSHLPHTSQNATFPDNSSRIKEPSAQYSLRPSSDSIPVKASSISD
ncbi:hypothetical protein N0V83_001968 [Neocucurbitaria cava]|uniref:Uncharacterized protein n=1 Tax=Neocucurbitaria cava TaxID=798079 RepID=A0A9W8YD81_9PLEO|nr:hypothetical protein N0V83_001968 [Neocucurbitaria cava]